MVKRNSVDTFPKIRKSNTRKYQYLSSEFLFLIREVKIQGNGRSHIYTIPFDEREFSEDLFKDWEDMLEIPLPPMNIRITLFTIPLTRKNALNDDVLLIPAKKVSIQLPIERVDLYLTELKERLKILRSHFKTDKWRIKLI